MVEQPTLDLQLPPPGFDESWVVRNVNVTTAERWLAELHYLGTRNTSSVEYGVFGPDMVALVSIGNPSNVFGVQGRLGLEPWRGNREITRVAVHVDAPRNAASRAVAAVCKQLRRNGLEWVFSYADTGQGHHGGIYQALNAVYCGIVEARPGYYLDGKITHPRTIVSMFGTQARGAAEAIAAERGMVLEHVEDLNAAKHTYILPVGDRRSKRAITQHLNAAGHVRPYPKRAGGVEETTPANQPGRAGSTPAPRFNGNQPEAPTRWEIEP